MIFIPRTEVILQKAREAGEAGIHPRQLSEDKNERNRVYSTISYLRKRGDLRSVKRNGETRYVVPSAHSFPKVERVPVKSPQDEAYENVKKAQRELARAKAYLLSVIQ